MAVTERINGKPKYRDVSQSDPCPICKHDSWCSVSEDGDWCFCRRVPHPQRPAKQDKNGETYHVHRLTPMEPRGDIPEPSVSLDGADRSIADPDTLHKIYNAFQAANSWCASEETLELERRGIKDVKAFRQRTKSYLTLDHRRLSSVAKLIQQGFEKDLPRVPGFTVREKNGRRYWSIGGMNGLLFASRDEQGRINKLLVRPREQVAGKKYLSISSSRHGGPGPGNPIHFPLAPEADRSTIRVTEGIIKADIATELSGMFTLGMPGVGTWKRVAAAIKKLGKGKVKTVRVAFDADARKKRTVAAALSNLLNHLREKGFAVELEVWPIELGKGIDDILVAGIAPTVLAGDAVLEEVQRIVREANEHNPPPPSTPSSSDNPCSRSRPQIIITTDEKDVNDKAVSALVSFSRDAIEEGCDSIYRRGTDLVRICRDARAPGGVQRPTAPRISFLPPSVLQECLAAAAEWRKIIQTKDGPDTSPAHPPGWSVNAIFDRAHWPCLPVLDAVVDHPVLLADGSILLESGYHEDSGLLIDLRGCPTPIMPANPTLDDATKARDDLCDVFHDFPFEKPCHKAAAISGVLTPLARFAFQGCSPLHLGTANTRGAGKGMTMNTISGIVTGQRMTVATYTDDGDELRKRITALGLAGERIVLFDNIDGDFGCPELDAALTTPMWTDRLLGESRIVTVPLNITWYGTGNNVQVKGDTSRRICPIRLETPEERPEEKKDFKHANLLEYVEEERPRLLGAALTILRAYILAGMPDQGLPPWGSFEGWSRLVRGAIVWVGLEDPANGRVEMQEATDTGAGAMKALLTALQAADPDRKGLTAAEMVDMAKGMPAKGTKSEEQKPGFHGSAAPGWQADLRDAIEQLAGRLDSRSLGNRLKHFRRRMFGGWYLDRAGEAKRAVRWAARPAKDFSDTKSSKQGESDESGESIPPPTHARQNENDSDVSFSALSVQGGNDSLDSSDSPAPNPPADALLVYQDAHGSACTRDKAVSWCWVGAKQWYRVDEYTPPDLPAWSIR